VSRDAELADDEHIQRQVEGAGDLIADRHASTWEGEDKRIVAGRVCLKLVLGGELPAGVVAIAERRRSENPSHRLSPTRPGHGHSGLKATGVAGGGPQLKTR
jgi:hypothetical protein